MLMCRSEDRVFGKLQQTGMTLIELLISMVIFVILLSMGVSSYRTWIANSRVRASADSIQGGLFLAKTEAMLRNQPVQFVLTTTEPLVGNVGAVTASTSGNHWMVRVFQSGGSYSSGDFVQGRSSNEAACTSISAGQAAFTFTGFGTLTPIPASAASINVSCTGSDRPLRITVGRGGAVRLCDPALAIATSSLGC
jgi:type IV fimbrial biogenesis protein FimT